MKRAVENVEESRWMTGAAAILLAAVPFAIFFARNWPLVHDVPLLHYVLFLMARGWAPYRDILEMNMPGSYMMEWGVLHTFGAGARQWLLWDITTGVITTFACCWVAGAGRRAAGLAAGALIYLLHLSNGPVDLGQRDWIVAILLLVAVGFLCEVVRRDQPAWSAGAMCSFALAASIKPHVVILAIAFLLATCLRQRSPRDGLKVVGWSAVGALPPVLLVVAFLTRWNVTPAFMGMLRGLLPWYATLERIGYLRLLEKSLPGFLLPGAAVAAYLLWKNRSWHMWERSLVLAGVGAGIFMYMVQRKGWPYHKYTSDVFLLLWIVLEIGDALRGNSVHGNSLPNARRQRAWAMATVVVTLGAVLPFVLYRTKVYQYPLQTVTHMQTDLEAIGGSSLSGNIQCLDMTYGGCINVLYRMKLVQATGFIYDFYLFPKQGNPVTASLQDRFLREMEAKSPRVIVLCSHTWPGDVYNYDQVGRWPAFQAFLTNRYQLDREYVSDFHGSGYRIYELRERASR